MIYSQRNKAMTLVELLTAFFLTVVALGVGFMILAAAMDTLTGIRTRQQTSGEARVALERMGQEFMVARTYRTNPNSLELTTTQDDTVIWRVVTLDAVSVLQHGSAEAIEANPTAQVAAYNISALDITEDADQAILAVTLSNPNQSFKITKTIQRWANTIP